MKYIRKNNCTCAVNSKIYSNYHNLIMFYSGLRFVTSKVQLKIIKLAKLNIKQFDSNLKKVSFRFFPGKFLKILG